MKNKKFYEWMLTIVYIAMVLLCIFLNYSTSYQGSLANIVVNVVMFVIVGIIFLSADTKCFGPMNNIIHDLNLATKKIKEDALNTHSFLWTPYQTNNVELFKTKTLQDILRDYVFDLNREDSEKYYKPVIDDYINETIVDKTMHRGELNQVAGILTGLGILGTFIGLSLGLQNFNTGTTAEMTNSIEPLMNGIKVAFHTSIYGMVFSLVFNSIYRKKLYEAETAVQDFISAFKKYVLPDTTNSGMNQMIALQKKQLNAISNATSSMTEEIANLITPHLDRLHEEIVDFENMATRNQVESMTRVVEFFIEEMNKSLSNTFVKLDVSVSDMYRNQTNNANLMEEVLKEVSKNAGNISDVNREAERLVSVLNSYSNGIQSVLDELQKTLDALTSNEDNCEKIIADEYKLLREQSALLNDFRESVERSIRASLKNGDDTTEALSDINESLYLIRKALDDGSSKSGNRR